MSPHPAVLILVLCLGQTVHMEEILPEPSIMAEPSTRIIWGRPVTIVCQSPAGFETFRLEKEGSEIRNKKSLGPETEARFSITVSNNTAGDYQCIYTKDSKWSTRSEELKLVITTTLGLKTGNLYVLIGLPVTFLLCFLLLLLVFWLLRKEKGFLRSKDQKQKLQERFSPGTDDLERMSDIATADRLPGTDVGTDTLTPAAGRPQEVTYAQLDHHRGLTQKAAPAVSPQSLETTAEYATIARH